MAVPARVRTLSLGWVAGGVLWSASLRLLAADPPPCFELRAHIAAGMRTTRDQPMSVLWIEDAEGHFVRTLWRFGRQVRWYQDLTVWHALSSGVESSAEVDAVTGATIIQGDQGCLRIPTRWQGLDLLSGQYALRIESRKDQARHYSSFRIPLTLAALGQQYADHGYVRRLDLVACAPGVVAPVTVQALSMAHEPVVQSPPSATDTSTSHPDSPTKEHP